MKNRSKRNIDAYGPTLLILIFVSLASSTALDYSEISGAVDGRVKRGLILNTIDKIIHPGKKEPGVIPGSDSFSFEKQLAFQTPLGGFSVSSSVHKKQTSIPLNPHQSIPPVQVVSPVASNQPSPTYPWQQAFQTDYSAGRLPSSTAGQNGQELGQYSHGAEQRPLFGNTANPVNPIANINKEKDEIELVHGSGVPYNKPYDKKPNEGGAINISKKDTEKNTSDCENRDKEILESVFGSNPEDKEISGAGNINVRSGV